MPLAVSRRGWRVFLFGIFVVAAGQVCAPVSHGIPVIEGGSLYHVTTIAGDGRKGRLDGKGAAARFNWPTGVSVAGDGTVYVSDYSNNLIRRIDPDTGVKTIAGSGRAGFADGKGAAAFFSGPDNITMDSSGNFYVADADNFRVRKIAPDGTVSTVAGSGVSGYRDGKAGSAAFGYPTGIAVDDKGVLYVSDRRTHTVRKITGGAVTTLAGNGIPGYADGEGIMSHFSEPISIAVTGGVVYVADSGNNAIRKITPDGAVTTIAGGMMAGYRDGRGREALFSWPTGIALDALGNMYVCDSNNNKIRRVTPDGVVSTVAGGLFPGASDGWGLRASFTFPTAVAVDRLGGIYVADSGNNKIRKITYGELQEARQNPGARAR
ncbi:MAG: SMP-30/gluconolactonase/LRE family protein [Deltaproteobacteria bacterium]|nr:SMP-30/gluconolactonase/LRE family protein [Deltaproteobacteria bacterium]